MIRFVMTQGNTITVRRFVRRVARRMRGRVGVVTYPWLERQSRPPDGVWVFTDMERLAPAAAEAAAGAADRLAARGMRVLNHPTRTMRRHELLKTLHAEGVNSFTCHRLDQPLPELRFPVFLRREDDHNGPVSGLLQDEPALAEALAAHDAAGRDRRDTIVVEWMDTRGGRRRWRQAAAFVVAGSIIPRRVMVADQWMVKIAQASPTPEAAAEGDAYCAANPHAQALAEVARLARVEYGRIDYGLKQEGIEVWEINSNPQIFLPTGRELPAHEAQTERFLGGFLGALAELEGRGR